MILEYSAIDRWPGELSTSRRSSPFSASRSETMRLLERELGHLEAQSVVLQIAVRPADVRLDGKLRPTAKRAHPGVILAFDSKHGPLTYPCDSFSSEDANLRAIALGLESLRRVDRYGITIGGQQYAGWKQLASGIALSAGFETRASAAEFIVEHAVDALGNRLYDLADVDDGQHEGAFLTDAFRYASKRMHPDAGGDSDLFARLVAARDRLAD